LFRVFWNFIKFLSIFFLSFAQPLFSLGLTNILIRTKFINFITKGLLNCSLILQKRITRFLKIVWQFNLVPIIKLPNIHEFSYISALQKFLISWAIFLCLKINFFQTIRKLINIIWSIFLKLLTYNTSWGLLSCSYKLIFLNYPCFFYCILKMVFFFY